MAASDLLSLLPDRWAALVREIRDGPIAWRPAGRLPLGWLVPALAEAGILELGELPEGPCVTLTPWAAERLGVHLIEARDRKTRREAEEVMPLDPIEAAYRWAPLDEEGPAPVQPRERPCVVRPRFGDGIRAIDHRLQEAIDRETRAAVLGSGEGVLDVFAFATRDHRGRRPERGGLDVRRRRPA